MTDAQQIFNFARLQFNGIAADVERHFDQVADSLRDTFSKIKTPQFTPQPPPPPPTTLQLVQRWLARNKALTAALLAFVTTGSVAAIVYAHSHRVKKRRRARKSPSGARTDVVVVAGAVANPLTSALYLDLERRGFVVYVVANSSDDELYIRSQSRADVIPLSVDPSDPFTAQAQMSRFQDLLARDHYAFDGAAPHRLTLAGLILVPDTQTSSSTHRIEDISGDEWTDALHARVLGTIHTTQLLLPSVVANRAKILLLTPSVAPALQLPMHGLENTVSGALKGFVSTLAAEMAQEGLRVSHFKLGNIDVPSVTARQRREGALAPRLRSTPLRRLHDDVFDALVSARPSRVKYVGRGSLTYEMIGRWVPPSWIGWMMGAVARQSRRSSDSGEGRFEDLRASAGSLTWEKVDEETSSS